MLAEEGQGCHGSRVEETSPIQPCHLLFKFASVVPSDEQGGHKGTGRCANRSVEPIATVESGSGGARQGNTAYAAAFENAIDLHVGTTGTTVPVTGNCRVPDE